MLHKSTTSGQKTVALLIFIGVGAGAMIDANQRKPPGRVGTKQRAFQSIGLTFNDGRNADDFLIQILLQLALLGHDGRHHKSATGNEYDQ
jgi:hypothetical protein